MASNDRVDRSDDAEVSRLLSYEYIVSDGVVYEKRDWNPVLNHELCGWFSELIGSLKAGLSRMARLRIVMTERENTQTAEDILHSFIDKKHPWLRKALEDYQASICDRTADLPAITHVDDCDDDSTDARSFTMPLGMETSPTMARFEPITNMGPPPRSGGCAPEAPMTPATQGVGGMMSGGEPSSARREVRTSSASRGDADPALGLKSKGKRPLNGSSAEEPEHNSGTPSKRPKTSEQAAGSSNTTALARPKNVVDFFDVEQAGYIFADERCGHGWYIIKCNLSHESAGINEPVQFTQHPFQNDLALRHFNDNSMRCHEPKSRYTEEDIIREFAFRVYENSTLQIDVADDDVLTSNDTLDIMERGRKDADAARGVVCKKSGRGKGRKKSGESSNRIGRAHGKSVLDMDMEDSYRDEVSIWVSEVFSLL